MRNKSLVCFLAVTVTLFALLAFWPSHTKAQSVMVALAPYVACGSVTSSTVGSKIGTYVSGTSTPQTTYQDPAGQSPNQNPISLNGNSAQIWLQTGLVYRFVVQDSTGVTQCTIDSLVGVGGGSGGGASSNWSSLLPGTNTAAGTFIASGNGWDFSAANLFKAPVAAGISPSAVGSFGYDSSGNKWQFFQNGAPIGFAVQGTCAANQFVNGLSSTAASTCAQPSAANLTNGTTGSGGVVLATSPALTTPKIGGITVPNAPETTWTAVCPGIVNSPCIFVGTGMATGIVASTVLSISHVLSRVTVRGLVNTSITTGCTGSPVVSFRDETAASNLANITLSNGTAFFDSGALSVSMTAGDQFSFNLTTQGSGCTTGTGYEATAVYQ